MKINRLIGTLCCFIALNVKFNLQGTPMLSSDLPIVYDTKNKCSVAQGNAEFTTDNLRLQSDCIYYFSENAKALAKGRLRITNPQLRLSGNEGVYWISDKKVEMDTFRLEVKGHNVSGKNLKGPLDCLTAEQVRIDYNGVQKDLVGVHITAKQGVLHGHDYFELYDSVLHIGQLPVFYSPYYRHDFDRSTLRWKSHWALIQRNKTYGRYVRNDLLLDFGWRVKPGIMFDYYRKRDFLLGGILEYNEDWGHGSFKAARIHDKALSKYPTNNSSLKNARYFSEWRHQGFLGDSMDMAVQMDWMRDKDFLKDFRPDENDGTRQHPDNFAEISHRTDNAVTSVISRFRLNRFQHIQERLPEIRWEYLPVKLEGTPLYYQYGVGVGHLREKPISRVGNSEKELRRTDMFLGLTAPLNVCSWATFTPVASTRMAHYWHLDQSPQHHTYTRWLGQFGFDLRFHAYGEYSYNNDYWNIHNFRHIIQPVVQYRYLPHGKQGNSFISSIDREGIEGGKPSLQSIDLLNRRDIDSLNDMHLLRLGIENFLYTNYEKGEAKEWLYFNIYQDIRLQRDLEGNVKQKKLTDTFADLGWSPASFFSFNQYLRVDPTNKRLNESNTSVSFKENDLWTLSCSHSYTRDGGSFVNQNTLGLSYQVNSTNLVSASVSFDAHKRDLISQTYTWSTIIAKTWKFDLIFKWKKRQRPLSSVRDVSWDVRYVIEFIQW